VGLTHHPQASLDREAVASRAAVQVASEREILNDVAVGVVVEILHWSQDACHTSSPSQLPFLRRLRAAVFYLLRASSSCRCDRRP